MIPRWMFWLIICIAILVFWLVLIRAYDVDRKLEVDTLSSDFGEIDHLQARYREIRSQQIPVNRNCGQVTNVNESDSRMIQYHNLEFEYVLNYDPNLFDYKELNDCSLVAFVPKITNEDVYAEIYKYYLSITALKLDRSISIDDWVNTEINNDTNADVPLKVRSFIIGDNEAREVGPYPGMVDSNNVIVSNDRNLISVYYYPVRGNDMIDIELITAMDDMIMSLRFDDE